MLARRLVAPLNRFQFSTRDLLWAVLLLAVALSHYAPGKFGIVATDRELDLAILGKGYFIVEQSNSHLRGYVRHGKFSINNFGQLCFGRPLDGWLLQPQITFPQDHQQIEIAQDGTVRYYQLGNPQPQQAGQLQLATFIGNDYLHETVPDVFLETQDSGVSTQSNPGIAGAGLIRQGALEYRRDDRPFQPQTVVTVLAIGLAVLILRELQGIRARLAPVHYSDVVAARFTAGADTSNPRRGELRLNAAVGDGHLL